MNDREREVAHLLSRRTFLRRSAGVGAAGLALGSLPALLAACGSSATSAPGATAAASAAASVAAGGTSLKVLTNQPPDPAPPGVAKYSADALAKWQTDNAASVVYESIPYTQIHDKLATAFASGNPPWDIVYMSGWAPEFDKNLVDLGALLPQALKDDLPKSSFKTVTWDGKVEGVVFTLSLMTLFYNTEQFDKAGLKEPPKTWDDLKRYAKELTTGGQYGWVLNYGAPEGIGGTANLWMIFLQSAGGTMYAEDGSPAFNAAPGIDALQLMIDLWPYTEPGAISYVGIADTTNVFTSGKASMMLNWPFMWVPANDPTQSKIAGKLGSAVIPAGPAGTASVDGTDAWTITKASKSPELAAKLIEFYLDTEVQKRQLLDTGWLPIRMSALADPAVQKAAPNAAVVAEQAKSPYDSFVTPDYIQVTQAIGTEIQKALKGEKTAKQAIADASDQAAAVIKQRK
jgi:multiple sugar transport system substrate-binding protein